MNVYQRRFKGIVTLSLTASLFMALFLGGAAFEKLQAQPAPQVQQNAMPPAPQQPGRNPDMPPQPPRQDADGLMKGLGLVGAGIAFGLAALGAGVGIGSASSAAIGALSEKPGMFGISLVFVALCEGLVIFGFVIAAMIMGRI